MSANPNPLPHISPHGLARRIFIDRQHPVEKAIFDAHQAVEHMPGADPLLTRAGTLLMEAKDLVSDWLEGKVGEFNADGTTTSRNP